MPRTSRPVSARTRTVRRRPARPAPEPPRSDAGPEFDKGDSGWPTRSSSHPPPPNLMLSDKKDRARAAAMRRIGVMLLIDLPHRGSHRAVERRSRRPRRSARPDTSLTTFTRRPQGTREKHPHASISPRMREHGREGGGRHGQTFHAGLALDGLLRLPLDQNFIGCLTNVSPMPSWAVSDSQRDSDLRVRARLQQQLLQLSTAAARTHLGGHRAPSTCPAKASVRRSRNLHH